MPIYEYRCESCGEQLEKIQKFSDKPLKDCPACGKSTLKKLVSASSFRLKGSGWYETDFKTKKKQSSSDSADLDKGASDKPSDKSSSDSEPKAKTKDSSKGSTNKKDSA